ncbi:allene oxide cyclase barrel-like domain-containing protein [Streptomyces iconiensis]|uniref:DUF6531 domain-containing protein n=1 Tax=Streptomyces iconiensis TaxID=1384038 RepID=A0ABT7A812_9ACTN|nr:DUF6531 domain-containing protein [Streptomyces iconiensis]MDJ1137468.1 DUF6531 domain-containing protein [Streptomyces iconiensis]
MPTIRDTSTHPIAWSLPVGDRIDVLVDLAKGELIVRQTDLEIENAGGDLRLTREHRGHSRATVGFGPGWHLSHGVGRATPPPGDGEPLTVTDPQGRVITLLRDRRGLVTEIVDPLGSTAAAFGYDGAARLVAHTDASGRLTAFDWDAQGRLSRLTDPAGGAVSLTYTTGAPEGRPTVAAVEWSGDGAAGRTAFTYGPGTGTVTDASGRSTVLRFDAQDRLVSVTDPAANVWRRTWDDRGLCTAVTDADGHTTTYEYDMAGRPVGLRLPTSAHSTVDYADHRNPLVPTALRDPLGNELLLSYDSAGRLVRVGAPSRERPLDTRAYDPSHGSLASFTDGNGDTTYFDRDDAGHLIGVTPPRPLGPMVYHRDGLSRITAVTSGNGTRTGYRRDPAGRLTEVTDETAGRVLLTLAHDPLGRVVHKAGEGWSYDYTWIRTGGGSRLAAAVRTEGGATEEVRYTYTPTGELTSLTTEGGTVGYTYDAAGRPTSVTGPSGRIAYLSHDASGRLTRVDCGQATQEIRYDASGRRVSLTVHGPEGEESLRATYEYRSETGADGDVLRAAEVHGETVEFSYDGLKRLRRAGETEYAYDDAHHLVRLGDIRFTLNSAGQVVRFGETEFTYDGAGDFTEEVNPTGAFTYSATHQTLTGVFGGQPVVSADYDELGQERPRRITETALDGRRVTHVLTHSELGVVRVADDGSPTDFVRTPAGTLLAVLTPEGRHYWAVTDQQGSVLALLDEDGHIAARYRYTPHGAVTASGDAAAANPFRYRGAYQLLRSAHVLDHHLYNGFWGRFTQPDPTRRQYAPYTFSDNDPVNSGTWTRHDFWSALVGPPETAVATFFPEPPEWTAPPTPGISTGPGVAPDRTPLIAGGLRPTHRTASDSSPLPREDTHLMPKQIVVKVPKEIVTKVVDDVEVSDPKVGQSGTFDDELHDENGKLIGTSHGFFRIEYVRPGDGGLMSYYTEDITLDDGTLHAEGWADFNDVRTSVWVYYPLTGTSGRYEGLSGFRKWRMTGVRASAESRLLLCD